MPLLVHLVERPELQAWVDRGWRVSPLDRVRPAGDLVLVERRPPAGATWRDVVALTEERG